MFVCHHLSAVGFKTIVFFVNIIVFVQNFNCLSKGQLLCVLKHMCQYTVGYFLNVDICTKRTLPHVLTVVVVVIS